MIHLHHNNPNCCGHSDARFEEYSSVGEFVDCPACLANIGKKACPFKSAPKPKPHFQHDSDCCTWLGTVTFPDGEIIDMYSCGGVDNKISGTILARRSDEGYDYASGTCFAKNYLENPSMANVNYRKAMGMAYFLYKSNQK